MSREIPLGRLAGVKVSMGLTVPLVAVLVGSIASQVASDDVALQLAGTSYTVAFSPVGGGLPSATPWVVGAAGALLYFLSLLVHEMGHALVARDEGIGVRGISLWLLGGVAKLESAPTNARSEFRIAVVGPLASAAFGVLFLTLSYIVPTGGVSGVAANLFLLIGVLNLFLAAFNLLPAAPLDGGTVLSAFVWKRTGSQATGMRWAAYAGIAAGGFLVLSGLRALRTPEPAAGSWMLLLVGGFILYAAIRSLRSLPLYQLLDGTTVAEAMSVSPPLAPGWGTVGDFLRQLPPDTAHQSYPVMGEHGRVTGLLTAAAIRAVPAERWDQLRVSDLAYPLERLTVVVDDEPLLPAVQKIDGGDVREGLVVGRDGTVLGTIDAAALFKTLERRRAQLAAASS